MSEIQEINDARDVLRNEANALQQLADKLPADFTDLVAMLAQTSGRVIVSGIGKSGHVGRKIAATFASTGTPSMFVHPSEASHGDLGMIQKDDFVILISNSGETVELGDVLAYTRRFSIPLAAISSKADSTLMRAADYRLLLPNAPEACPMGMAPTTSTTMTIALGDALAVALMNRRGFRRENFRTLHPGGTLGAQLSTVGQLMHEGDAIPLVEMDTPMQEALLVMSAKGFGITGVMQDGRLHGIITDGDLRRHMADLLAGNAGDVATIGPVTVPPDLLAAQALALMNKRKITTIFVTEDGEPRGIIHLHDLLRAGIA